MTDQNQTEWTPQPCDPDAESVKPEGAEQASWDLLSDFEKHTITQHVHPDERVRMIEIGAFIAAAEQFGFDEAAATSLLLSAITKKASEQVILDAVNETAVNLPLIALMSAGRFAPN